MGKAFPGIPNPLLILANSKRLLSHKTWMLLKFSLKHAEPAKHAHSAAHAPNTADRNRVQTLSVLARVGGAGRQETYSLWKRTAFHMDFGYTDCSPSPSPSN